MKNIVAVAFPKGGTGKSTVAANLAAEAAKRGLRTLLIDLDPQGSSTHLSGYSKYETPKEKSAAAMFQDNPSLPSDLAQPTKFGYDIVPSSGAMVEAEAWLSRSGISVPRLRLLFQKRDQVMHEKYDFIIVDTIGAKHTRLLEAALLACSTVVIPLKASDLSTEEIPDFMLMLRDFSENREGSGDKPTQVAGFVVNGGKPNTNSYAEIMTKIDSVVGEVNTNKKFNFGLLKRFAVPDGIAIEEAASAKTPVSYLRPKSAAAIRYNELFSELFPNT